MSYYIYFFIGTNFIADDYKPNKKCVHFYACLCAFASDPKLTEEFACYLNSELFSFQSIPKNNSLPLSLDNQLSLILESDPNEYCNIEIEVLNEQGFLGVPNLPISEIIPPHVQVHDLQVNPNGEVTIIGINDDAIQFSDLPESFESITEPMDLNSSFEVMAEKMTVQKNKKKIKSKVVKELAPKKKSPPKKKDNVGEEKRTQMSFLQWLTSVTERINQTMHYQFNGKPEALIFHIPQVSPQ